MTAKALLKKGLRYYDEHGTIRTVGAVARFVGDGIDHRCRTVHQALERDRGHGFPRSVRLRAAQHGMSAHSLLWLGLQDADASRYIGSNDVLADINSEHIFQLHDKYVFQMMTQPHLGNLPMLYGTIEDGTFRPLVNPEDELHDVLDRAGSVVLKPTRGGKGTGVSVIRRIDGEISVTGDVSTAETVSGLIAELDDYLVFEFVEQHGYASDIFEKATNTLRVHSIIDPETGEAGILRPVHRFGSEQSAPTDNWSRDGYIAPIDGCSGEVGELVVLNGTTRSRLKRHPDTGTRVAGVEVPYWDEIGELVCEAANLHRHAPIVGWDVLVSERGPVLIEGNARPHEVLLQLEEGLLADSRCQRLIEKYETEA